MSLIFRSLKKLKAQSAPENTGSNKAKAGNVYSYRKLIFSPQAFIVLFVLVLIAGFSATKSIRFIQDNFLPEKQSVEHKSIAENTKQEIDNQAFVNPITSTDSRADKNIPPPPEGIPFKPATPGRLILSSGSHETVEESEGSGTRFGALSYFKKETGKNEKKFASNVLQPEQLELRNENNHHDTPVREPEFREPINIPVNIPAAITDKSGNIHLSTINKQAEITGLVLKIERAIEKEDISGTEGLLVKLADIKGKENHYVLKLEAFLLILKKDYTGAEKLLKKALSASSEDLNAEINMAVIEIRTGRMASAKKRLSDLYEMYPENSAVHELLEQLQ